jgi:hypothetical protein
MLEFEGRRYLDDRMFVVEVVQVMARTTGGYGHGGQRWAVITRRNIAGLPATKVDEFDTREAAVAHANSIESTIPLISLGGKSPPPAPAQPA